MSILKKIVFTLSLTLFSAATQTYAEGTDQPALHATSVFRGEDSAAVALVQLNSTNTGNWSVIESWVAQAKAKGAEFVVFPESSYLGWLNPEAFSDATVVPGPVTEALAEIAIEHEVYIAFGFAEQGPQVSEDVYLPYDAGTLIGPDGSILIHSRKHQVLKNAFNPADCPEGTTGPSGGCSYYQATVDMIPVVDTPLGKTAVLVCADAYTYDTAALDHVKDLGVETIIVVWGVAAGQQDQCGAEGFNATGYASQTAEYTGAMVIGANAVAERPYGRFLPSVYCGYSGIVAADGTILASAPVDGGVYVYDVPIP